MAQQIEVPGMGIVEFPDGMDDAAISAAIKANMPQRGVIDKLTGRDGGERYQTWPEKLVRGAAGAVASGASLPGDVMAGKDSPENTGRVLELATMGTPASAAARAGEKAIPGVAKAMRAEPAVVPTTQELAESGAKNLNAFRDSGLEVTSNSVADLARRIQQRLYDEKGISEIDAPATFAKLKALENAPPGSYATAANLKSLRDSLGITAQNFNPQAAKDQLAASRSIAALDEFIPNVAPKDVLAGSPAAAGQVLETGRGDYSAAMRSNDITGVLDRARTGLLERAEGRAQAANSGRNMDNTLRQKTESVLEKPKEISGYSDAELAALEHVVEGGGGRNLARNIANMLGGGGGAAQTIFAGTGAGIGAGIAGWPGAVVGAAVPATIGSGAKAIANALAKRDMRSVDELLRKRSPLYQERVANPEMNPINPEARLAIARALMADQFSQGAR